MIDRDVRHRLLIVFQILRDSKEKMSIKQIIEKIQFDNPLALVERRAIMADIKALELFGHVQLSSGKANTTYAQFADHDDTPETLQPEQVQKRASFYTKQDQKRMGRSNNLNQHVHAVSKS